MTYFKKDGLYIRDSDDGWIEIGNIYERLTELERKQFTEYEKEDIQTKVEWLWKRANKNEQ